MFLIMILIVGVMIGVPVPAKAKIRKPLLALPVFEVKTKTNTTITLDFSYMATKYYLKGKDAIDGYQLYRKVKGKWKKLCTAKVKGKKKKSLKKTYKDKKLTAGTKYKYRVRTFKKVTGTKKVKKGKRKVRKKYKKTFYSKYEYLNVTAKKENKKPTPTPTNRQKYDGGGNPIDDNYNYVDPFAEENKGYQQKMLNRINEYRKEKGLKPLALNLTMCQMASVRAKEAEQLFEHRRLDGTLWSTIFNDFNLDFMSEGKAMSVRAMGENLFVAGYGHSWDMVLGDCRDIPKGVNENSYVDDGWKQSPGHWACLMDEDADQFGIAHYFSAPPSAKPYLDKNLSSYPSTASYWVAITGASYEKK